MVTFVWGEGAGDDGVLGGGGEEGVHQSFNYEHT